ncbi:MAG TPA: hypothetical protein VFG33_03610 [Kribbella sp.]|uniref:hypothetical protein n=1 Tax=Kribbella sp. TaxID=1871183 RepID=UPI002D77E6F8|nr:hypothetical protein [Kribbella sp.]HET6292428.1 hypothetical protein [Kribbella sp.]
MSSDTAGEVRHGGPAVIRWQHNSGGAAYCLGRLVVPPAPERPVIVLSEVAGNPDAVGLTSDFAGAVPAALAALGKGLDPESIRWLAHHGDFSSYDAAGSPETFTDVQVRFDGGQYRSELTDQHLLPAAEAETLRRSLHLEPVPAALAALNLPA